MVCPTVNSRKKNPEMKRTIGRKVETKKCHQQLIDSMPCHSTSLQDINNYTFSLYNSSPFLNSVHSSTRKKKFKSKINKSQVIVYKCLSSSTVPLMMLLMAVVTCIAIGWSVTEVGVSVIVIVPLIGRRGRTEGGVQSCHRAAQVVVGG